MKITLTEITNNTGVICKKVDSSGVVTPAANVYDASARELRLEAEEISNYFDSLCSCSDKAIVLGTWKEAHNYEAYDIVTAGNEKEAEGIISRTSGYFSYANNDSVSLMLLDFDSKADDITREVFLDHIQQVLSDATIGGKKFMTWTRPSTSGSYSIDGKTGRGLHVFFPVKNAAPELVELIHRYCWLSAIGGGYKITSSGNVIAESLIDPLVKGPERICYTADAQIEIGDKVARECVAELGGVVDCELAVALLSELTVEFPTQWAAKKSLISQSDEVAAVKEQWKKDRIAKLVAQGVDEKKAKAETNALSDQVVLSTDSLLRTDGTTIPVRDILIDYQDWIGEKHFCDPIKQEVGRNVGMILKLEGRIVLKSFSHGGVYYWLKWTPEDLEQFINEIEDDELEERIGELIVNTEMSAIREKAILKSVSKRLNVGVTDVKSVVRDAKLNEFVGGGFAEEDIVTKREWVPASEDASHHEIIMNYIHNSGECKCFGNALYTWEPGNTIWKKQSVAYIKSKVGEHNSHVGLCRRVSDYSQIAKEIANSENILVEEWQQEFGFPCTDGFWAVGETEVSRKEYSKELGCRYKIKCAPDFNYSGNMPYFDMILENVDSKELFQQICGLAACGKLVDLQKVAVFQGIGGTGKGTISRVLSALFPARRITNINLSQMNDPKYLVELMDAVLNIVPEQDKHGKKITMTGFRAVTGGDYVSGWGLYKGVKTFKATCSHILNINQWPSVDGAGEELFRRVGETIVRFEKKNSSQVVGLDRLIIDNELPYVLGWLIDGVESFLKIGLVAGESAKNYENWVGSFDPVELFIGEFLIPDKRGRIERSLLWRKFSAFCEESNYFPMKKGEFFDTLRNHRYYVGEGPIKGSLHVKGFCWGV